MTENLLTTIERLARVDDAPLAEVTDLPSVEALFQQIVGVPVTAPADPVPPGGGRRSGRSPRRRLVTAVTGVAAAVVALVVALLVVPGTSGMGSAAAAVLDQAATAAGQATPLAPGQYLYTETQTQFEVADYRTTGATPTTDPMPEVASAQYGETSQAWTDVTGTGTVRYALGSGQFASTAARAAWDAFGFQVSTTPPPFVPGALTAGEAGPEQPSLDVSDLPTDPTALASTLADRTFGSNRYFPAGPDALFEKAATLLIGPDDGMTPALASALFQVMADQPGVQLLGTVTDHEGQKGTAIALPDAAGRDVSEIVVDPESGLLLEAQFVPPPPSKPAPGKCLGRPTLPDGSAPTNCTPTTGEAEVTQVWTDVVARGVVGSTKDTVPATAQAPLTTTVVPQPPTGVTATAGSGGSLQLSWTGPADVGAAPVTQYVVHRVGPTGKVAGSAPTHSAATSLVWPGGDPAGTYTVQAVNADGTSPASTPVTFSP